MSFLKIYIKKELTFKTLKMLEKINFIKKKYHVLWGSRAGGEKG